MNYSAKNKLMRRIIVCCIKNGMEFVRMDSNLILFGDF